MIDIKLEDVAELEKLQNENKLSLNNVTSSYYNKYSVEQIFIMQMTLRFDYYCLLSFFNVAVRQ